MDTLEKPELTTSIRHIARFLKSEIPIYNMESQLRLAEKQEQEGEEQGQLQSVMGFTQTQ